MPHGWRAAAGFLRALTPWVLSAFCLLLPITIAGMNIAAGILCGLVVLSTPARPPWDWGRLRNPALYALAAYLAVFLLCSAAGVGPRHSLTLLQKELHKLWLLAVLLPALPLIWRREAPLCLAAGFIFAAAVGLLQAAAQFESHRYFIRAHGFVHPVIYGSQLAMACLGAFCFLKKGARVNRMLYPCLAVGLAALAFNQTRMSLIAFAAGLLAVLLVDPARRRYARWALIAGLGMIALWEVIPTGNRAFSDLFHQLFNPDAKSYAHLVRYDLWSVAWRMFLDHPLLGVGPGHYRSLFPSYHPGLLDGQYWGSAHNLFLHYLAERGLLGFAALLAVFGALLWRAWRRICLDPGPWNLWAWGTMVAFLVMNLTEEAFETEQLVALVLFIWAVAEAKCRKT